MSDETPAAADERPAASAVLLPAVYDDLRALARRRMAAEPAGHTLQPTALVHEAYARLEGGAGGGAGRWNSRGHFFAAAAEAMRRVLIDRGRRKRRVRHGGGRRRVPLTDAAAAGGSSARFRDPAALAAALAALARTRPRAAAVVRLRSLEGRTIEQAAAALGVSRATAVRDWTLARAWLFRELNGDSRKLRRRPQNP